MNASANRLKFSHFSEFCERCDGTAGHVAADCACPSTPQIAPLSRSPPQCGRRMTHFGRFFFASTPAKCAAQEAVMDKTAIVGSSKRRWIGYVATIAAVLLGEFAIAMPAYSSDLYYPRARYGYGPYAPGPAAYYEGAAYRPSCSPCGCSRCGCIPRCAPPVHCCGSNVVERRWVDHEYVERRFVGGPYYRPYGYAGYQPYGYGYGGPRYGGVPPHLGYGGINYDYGQYPISYENEYDAPRPPIGIPGPYNVGYVE